jgi:hypothetical protein
VGKGICGTDKEFCNVLSIKYYQASVKDRAFVNQPVLRQQMRVPSLLGHGRAVSSGGLRPVVFWVVWIGFESRNGRNLSTLGFGDAQRGPSDRTGTVIDSETS